MARNQNTFEKRRREMEKKLKAVEKRERRQRRKEEGPSETPTVATVEEGDAEPSEKEPASDADAA